MFSPHAPAFLIIPKPAATPKTGKDITDTVIAQFSKKEEKKNDKKEKGKKEIPFLKTDKFVKWLGDIIDTKIEKVMEVVKLPTREQVANLDENIKAPNKKIDALKLSQEKTTKKKAAAPKKPAATPKTKAAKETIVKDTTAANKTTEKDTATAKKETIATDKKPITDKPNTENKTEAKTV